MMPKNRTRIKVKKMEKARMRNGSIAYETLVAPGTHTSENLGVRFLFRISHSVSFVAVPPRSLLRCAKIGVYFSLPWCESPRVGPTVHSQH
jgi:hypothetical protein